MFLPFVLITAFGIPYTTYKSGLDPSPILYPTGWYPNTIDLSSNNAGEIVTITINCKIPTTLSTGSTVVIVIPEFTITTYYYTLIAAQPSTGDNTFTFTDVVLPSPTTITAYGPISIYVYNPGAPNGDIIASAIAYGSIAVIPAKTISYSALTIAYTGTSIVLNSPASITFTFSLSVTLHANDYLMITIPSPFSESSANLDFTANNNSINNGNVYFLDAISVVQSNKPGKNNMVIAYGLKAFNYTGTAVMVSGILNGVITPSYVTTAASWSLEIFRFATHSTLYLYNANGPSTGARNGPGLIGGSITVSNWAPANGYLPYVYSGITTYMNFTMTVTHTIPASGKIIIIFSNLNINNYFLSENNSLYSPAVSGNGHSGSVYIYGEPSMYFNFPSSSISSSGLVLTLVNDITIPAGTSLIITNLATFLGSPPSIASITTVDSNSHIIDTLSGPYSIAMYKTIGYSIISPEPIIQVWQNQISTLASLNPGSLQVNAFVVSSILQGTTPLSSTTNITLSGPFSQDNTIQDMVFGFHTNNLIGIPGNSAIEALNSNSYFALSWYPTVTFSNYPTQFQFFLPIGISINQYINFMIYYGNSAGLQQPIYVPNFISNIYTRYEICFQYTISGGTTYGFCKPLTTFADTSNLVNFNAVCTSTGQEGFTVNLAFTPIRAMAPLGNNLLSINFKIEAFGAGITFDKDLSTGLVSGSTLPTYGFANPNDQNVTIWWDSTPLATNIVVNATNSPIGFSGSPISFYFPFVSCQPGATYIATAVIYYTRQSDNAKFIIQQDYSSTITSQVTSFISAFSATVAGADTIYLNTAHTLFIPHVFDCTSPCSISVIVPMGFKFTSAPTLNNFAVTGLFYSATNPSYPYPSLYYSNLPSGVTTLVLNGLVSPAWVPAKTNIYIATSGGITYNNSPICDDQIYFTLSMTPMNIAISNLSPPNLYLAVTQGGANATTLTLSCTAIVTGTITGDPTSTMTVTISPTASTGSTYTISGGVSFNGSFTGNSFTTSAITSSTIAVSTTFVISVTIPTPTILTAGFVQVSINYLGGIQYSSGTITHILRFSSTAGVTVNSGISSVSVFPNTANANNVHFQITFSPYTNIPVGSIITVSGDGFISDSNAKGNTWCTIGFINSAVSETNLVIVTRLYSESGSEITIRKDLAYNTPANAGPGHIWKISVVTAGGVSIISDSNIVNSTSSNTITYLTSPSSIISSFLLSTSTTNAGETGFYKFYFELSINLMSNDSIIIDVPFYYDAHFGPTILLDANPTLYFLTVTSSVSSIPICIVNHWLITCSLGESIEFNNPIDISILGLNPQIPNNYQTATEVFSLYILDSLSNIKAITQLSSNTLVLTPVPAALVDLYSVIPSSTQAVYSDYTFVLYSSETYSALGSISILFPSQYNFARDQTNSTIINQCSGAYYTKSSTGISESDINLSECTLNSSNLATFTFYSSPSFISSNEIELILNSITNPTMSSSYNQSNSLLDTITSAYLSPYNFWTGKFTLYTKTNSMSTAWSSRTYGNTNAAFAGFLSVNLKSLSVNGGSNIYVIPGTYSKYYTVTTETGTLSSQLILNPNAFSLSIIPSNLTLYTTAPLGLFKVGASIETATGVYYITWNIIETPPIPNEYLYLNVVRTQVQVYAFGNSISITFTNPSPVPNPGSSLPIILSCAPYYTYSDFSLNLAFNSNVTTLFLIPSILEYNSNVNSLGFQVISTSTLLIGNTYTIIINILGTDASVYSVPTIQVSIGGKTEGSVLSDLNFISNTPNILNINVKSTGAANIYWIFSTTYAYNLNANYSSFSYAKQYAYPLYGSVTEPTKIKLTVQYADYNTSINVAGLNPPSYLSYIVKLQLIGNNHSFICMDSIPEGSNSYSTVIYNLLANTNYTMTIWADNLSKNISSIKGTTITPSSSASILTLKFVDNPNNLLEHIISALAIVAGQPSYLFSKLDESPIGSGVSINVAVYPNPVNTKSTLAIANDVQSNNLISTLSDFNVITAGVTLSARESTTEDFPNPEYYNETFNLPNSNSLFFNFTSKGNGQIYYVIESNPPKNYNIIASNIILGQARNGLSPLYAQNLRVNGKNLTSIYFNITFNCSVEYCVSILFCNDLGICQNDTNILGFTYNYNCTNTPNNSSSGLLLIILISVIIVVAVSLLIL